MASRSQPWTINVSQLRSLSESLRKFQPELLRELEAGLVKAGDFIAQDAKRRASFSTRIPGSIRVNRRRTVVRVVAGNKRAPHAAALNNAGQAGTFRHPVFGNTSLWVNQKAHPFMQPAAEAQQENVAKQIALAVDNTLGKLGF